MVGNTSMIGLETFDRRSSEFQRLSAAGFLDADFGGGMIFGLPVTRA
jgi:hypothetical protein